MPISVGMTDNGQATLPGAIAKEAEHLVWPSSHCQPIIIPGA